MSLHICPNPQDVQYPARVNPDVIHGYWGGDVSYSVCRALIVRETLHTWGRKYMRSLCTSDLFYCDPKQL
jgi:hypothetical protein